MSPKFANIKPRQVVRALERAGFGSLGTAPALGSLGEFGGVWGRGVWGQLPNWMPFHNTPWMRDLYHAQFAHQYMFSVEKLEKSDVLNQLSGRTGVSASDLLYALDNVFRLPLYGEFAGENEHYLNHPLRDVFRLPTAQEELGVRPHVTVSFRDSISEFASKLTQDEYTILLHELRGLVREHGLHELGRGQFEKEVIREIAAKVALPARIRGIGKVAAVAGGLLGGLSAIPLLGPAAAVAGAGISVSTALWTRRLPRAVSRVRWLRWALRWDVEDQSEKRG